MELGEGDKGGIVYVVPLLSSVKFLDRMKVRDPDDFML